MASGFGITGGPGRCVGGPWRGVHALSTCLRSSPAPLTRCRCYPIWMDFSEVRGGARCRRRAGPGLCPSGCALLGCPSRCRSCRDLARVRAVPARPLPAVPEQGRRPQGVQGLQGRLPGVPAPQEGGAPRGGRQAGRQLGVLLCGSQPGREEGTPPHTHRPSCPRTASLSSTAGACLAWLGM